MHENEPKKPDPEPKKSKQPVVSTSTSSTYQISHGQRYGRDIALKSGFMYNRKCTKSFFWMAIPSVCAWSWGFTEHRPGNGAIADSSYLILDSQREEQFERITAMASRVFDAPIALISLVDLARQWFRSNRGLGDTRQTPRNQAFCSHAILTEEIYL